MAFATTTELMDWLVRNRFLERDWAENITRRYPGKNPSEMLQILGKTTLAGRSEPVLTAYQIERFSDNPARLIRRDPDTGEPRYLIRECFGASGQGQVCAAVEVASGALVAVKRMLVGHDPTDIRRERAEREIKGYRKIGEHPKANGVF